MRRSLRVLAAVAGASAVSGTAVLVAASTASADGFTPADFVVYRVGAADATTLTNNATSVFLDRFSSGTVSDTPSSTVAVPGATVTGTQHLLTAAGLSRSEGQLTRSADGTLVAFAGYDAASGTTGPTVTVSYADGTSGNVVESLTATDPASVQDLDAVYRNTDPRTYPMSSYSYMIVPTTTASPMTTDKGKALSTFINYFLCAGQKKAGILGYSPLPSNLVTAGFDQVRKIPGFVEPPQLSSCDNPALTILSTAPQPDPCTKATPPASCSPAGSTPVVSGPVATQAAVSSGTGHAVAPGVVVKGSVGPYRTVTGSGPVTGASGAGSTVPLAADPAAVTAIADPPLTGRTKALYAGSAALLVGVVVLPPLLLRRVRRRRL